MSLLEKTLAENGTFVMKMPSLKKKKEVCKRHINSYSYQSKKGGNPESNLDYKVDKVEDESIQRKLLFLHALIRTSVKYKPSTNISIILWL